MHGVSGGNDAYLQEDAITRVRNALLRTLDKEGGTKELKKAAKDAIYTLLWERTKTRPMVVVSILEV